jgi:hypothetical protein
MDCRWIVDGLNYERGAPWQDERVFFDRPLMDSESELMGG